MNYILHKQILFNPDELFLQNMNTQDKVFLPATAAYILVVLIEKSNEVCERNYIFDEVWQRFTTEVSGNTLNQYISLLRKNFRTLGVTDELIITSPRVGFCLSCEVKMPYTMFKSNSVLKAGRNNMFYLVIITIAALVIFSSWHRITKKYHFPDSGLILSGNIDGCALFITDKLNDTFRKEAYEDASSIARRLLPCKENSIFIFDISYDHLLKDKGRYFLSRCKNSSAKESVESCVEVVNEK
jgi:DNA-binding winged-HTH domains